MKILRDIICDMDEELHDAKHRIKRAGKMKLVSADIAKRELEIAQQELQHAEKDHMSAVELITAYKKNNDMPEIMSEIWNEAHDKYIEKVAKLKIMIETASKS